MAGIVNDALSERGGAVVTAPPGAGKSTLLPLTILDALPEGKVVAKVLLNGMPVAFEETVVGESHYVDFSAGSLKGRADIEILFKTE